MGTRSDIIVQRTDATWKRIYCHWDGDLEHNGKILFGHYNSQARAEELVAPGDLSSLGIYCDKPDGHSYENRALERSVYYGRDCGETNANGDEFSTLQEAWPPTGSWTEFTYVWSRDHGAEEGAWYVADPDADEPSLVLLGSALQNPELAPKTLVKAFGLTLGRRA